MLYYNILCLFGSFNLVHKHHCFFPHYKGRLRNGCNPRLADIRNIRIVKAHNRNIVRNLQPAVLAARIAPAAILSDMAKRIRLLPSEKIYSLL